MMTSRFEMLQKTSSIHKTYNVKFIKENNEEIEVYKVEYNDCDYD